MTRRALLVAPLFPPAGGPESFVNGKLALALMDAGWEVDIVTAPPGNGPDASRLWAGLKTSTSTCGRFGSSVLPYRVRAATWVVAAALRVHRLLTRRDYACVLTRSQPPWAHLAGLLGTKGWNGPWIANWNDPAPARRFPPPYGGGPGAKVSWASGALFSRVCRSAALHTFPCERLREYMGKYMPSEAVRRTAVVPHLGLRPQGRSLEVSGRCPVLLHAGSLYYRKWNTLLVALASLQAQTGTPGLELVLLGWQPPDLMRYLEQMGPRACTHVMPACSYEVSLEWMEQAAALVLVETDCEEGIFLPSKLADYAAVRRPILAISPRVGTVRDLLEGTAPHVVCDIRDQADINRGLRLLVTGLAARTQLAAQDDLACQFEAESVLRRLEGLIQQARDKKARRHAAASRDSSFPGR